MDERYRVVDLATMISFGIPKMPVSIALDQGIIEEDVLTASFRIRWRVGR